MPKKEILDEVSIYVPDSKKDEKPVDRLISTTTRFHSANACAWGHACAWGQTFILWVFASSHQPALRSR